MSGVQGTMLGTGDAGGVPLYGCDCPACARARQEPRFRRRPCSAVLETGASRLLVDAGLFELGERYASGGLDAVLLTHYHLDHVQGLFALRWGLGPQLPVYSPPDRTSCPDLHKNHGLLRFQWLQPFAPLRLGEVTVTAVPLQHSKPTFGYCLQAEDTKLAYLCDTVGLPAPTLHFLQQWQPDAVVLDCCLPPQGERPRNHNDVDTALTLVRQLAASRFVFTHVGHRLDCWLMEHPLPPTVTVAYDGDMLF